MTKLQFLTFAALMGAAIVSPAHATPFADGNFEAGQGPWTFTNFNLDASNPRGGSFDAATACDLTCAGIVGTPSISQTFDTVGGSLYSLSFWAALAFVSNSPGTAEIKIVWDGATVFDETPPALDESGPYALYGVNNLLATGSDTLTIAVIAERGGVTFVDDISLAPTAPAAPEPGSLALLGAGVSAIGLLRRKSSKRHRNG